MKILHKNAAMTSLTIAALVVGTTFATTASAWQAMRQDNRAQPAPASPPAGESDMDAGQTMRDAWITGKVKAALLADDGVKGTAFEVQTRDGIVRLQGRAHAQSEIDRAKRIAMGIQGVREVDVRSVGIVPKTE